MLTINNDVEAVKDISIAITEDVFNPIKNLDLIPNNEAALEIFSIITPFDAKILFELNREKYDRITKENLKIHALIAELGAVGAGQTLVEFVMQRIIAGNSLSQENWWDLYALLEYGKKQTELTPTETQIARKGEIVKESAHFSEIMSIDQLGEDASKRIVGQTSLVDKSLSRLLQNYEGRRRDRHYLVRLPVKHDAQPGGRCRFIQEQEVILTRHRYPNCAAMLVSEIRNKLTELELIELYKLLEIEKKDGSNFNLSCILKKLVYSFEVLLCKYPVEQALAFFDKLIFDHTPLQNLQLSFVLAQTYKDENNKAMLKVFIIGNGSLVLLNKTGDQFKTKDMLSCASNSRKMGNLFQPRFMRKYITLEADAVVLLLPPGYEKTSAWDKKFIEAVINDNLKKGWQSVSNEFIRRAPRFMRGKRSAMFPLEVNLPEIDYFKRAVWANERISSLLKDFHLKIRQYADNYKKLRVGIQFSHIHSNRGVAFGDEQKRATQITKVMHQELSKIKNIQIRLEPLVDNHHVTDALNYRKFEDSVSQKLGCSVSEILLEDSLPIGLLSIQIFKKLLQNKRDFIDQKGEKVFLTLPSGALIQLFDDVSEHTSATIGCVLFEAGLEIYRLNPAFANQLFFEWLAQYYPNSVLHQWHIENKDLTYHELVIRNLYGCIHGAVEREKMKVKLIYNLLPTYSIIINDTIDTSFLDKMLDNYLRKKENADEESIMIHVLEGLLYGDQGKKFRSLCEVANLPVIVPRINFDDDSGVVLFDLPDNF